MLRQKQEQALFETEKPKPPFLLPLNQDDPDIEDFPIFTLVLDLDETLIHYVDYAL